MDMDNRLVKITQFSQMKISPGI